MSASMEEVLIAHQRRDSRSCLCGWDKLGHSHPGHQAEQLAANGYGKLPENEVSNVWYSYQLLPARLDIGPIPKVDDPRHAYRPNPSLMGVPVRKLWGVNDVPAAVVVDGGGFVGYIMQADLDALPTPESVQRAARMITTLMAKAAGGA